MDTFHRGQATESSIHDFLFSDSRFDNLDQRDGSSVTWESALYEIDSVVGFLSQDSGKPEDLLFFLLRTVAL